MPPGHASEGWIARRAEDEPLDRQLRQIGSSAEAGPQRDSRRRASPTWRGYWLDHCGRFPPPGLGGRWARQPHTPRRCRGTACDRPGRIARQLLLETLQIGVAAQLQGGGKAPSFGDVGAAEQHQPSPGPPRAGPRLSLAKVATLSAAERPHDDLDAAVGDLGAARVEAPSSPTCGARSHLSIQTRCAAPEGVLQGSGRQADNPAEVVEPNSAATPITDVCYWSCRGTLQGNQHLGDLDA